MVKLFSTTILGFASTLVVGHVAAVPLHHVPFQRRAVDVGALTHNQDRPAPAPLATPALSDRAVNPEGFVPYLHNPSEAGQQFNDKRDINQGSHSPYQHDSRSFVETRYFDRERVPLPRPVPQQQENGGTSGINRGETKRDTDPIIDNLGRKPVNVVPIVGRAVDPEAFNSQGRQPVDVVPIVGRAVDPTVSDNIHEKPVDVVPIVGRDDGIDLIVSQNLQRKPVDVVPIVGRAVDAEASTTSSRTCGPEALKYDPTEEFCDGQGTVQPLSPSTSGSPTRELSPGIEKRNALPEPQTDKVTCNEQRYLPSQQNCTANGDLVNNVPQTPHNSKAPPPGTNTPTTPTKRAISQCGSGIGSIQYDRATEYCNPITQQVSPLKNINVGSPMLHQGRPALVPIAAREPATRRSPSPDVSPLLEAHQPISGPVERKSALVGPEDSKEVARGCDSTAEDCNSESEKPNAESAVTASAYHVLSANSRLTPFVVIKRDTARCNMGATSVEYDPTTQVCDKRTGQVFGNDDKTPAYQALTQNAVPAEGSPKPGKRDRKLSPAKIPFWEYWYDDTYDSDVDNDSEKGD